MTAEERGWHPDFIAGLRKWLDEHEDRADMGCGTWADRSEVLRCYEAATGETSEATPESLLNYILGRLHYLREDMSINAAPRELARHNALLFLLRALAGRRLGWPGGAGGYGLRPAAEGEDMR